MIVVLSLLFVAFLFGIWMGMCFYRRVTVKNTASIPIVRRYTGSHTETF